MFKVGQKVIIMVNLGATGEVFPHFGKVATVREVTHLKQVRVSIDNFPSCNHPEIHNRFWFMEEELKAVNKE